MLKSIRFTNYKAFGNGKLKIQPITILLGANSSGKSSLMHWSSTEGGDYVAYGCYIYDQRQTAPSRETKCYTQWVRAVAAF